MARLSIKFHPLFIVLAFALIYFGWLDQFVIYFIVLCLHEFAHYYVAKKLGYTLNKVVFMPYGAGIGGGNKIINPKHEIIIAFAGPLFNLILALLCVAIWWVFPVTYAYTELFVFCNLALAIFNFLPVFPLDGGRVVVSFLTNIQKRAFAYKLMKLTGVIFGVLFAISFLISVFYKVNLTFFFISTFLISACFGNEANIYYERAQVANFAKKKSMPMGVKNIAVNNNTPLYQMLKHINSYNYTIFYVLDNNKVKKILTESEVLELFNNDKKI